MPISLVSPRALFAAACIATGALSGVAAAQDEPLLVTYGADASAVEGDHDHRQTIYLTVPQDSGPVFVRLFDPDAGGLHDTIFGNSWPVEGDTNTRFAVFGGEGAYVVPSNPRNPDAAAEDGGVLLVERTFGDEPRYDGKWVTLAELDPASGELRGDAYVFRLQVEGLSGDDGNLFDVFASASNDGNEAVDGASLSSFVPTLRVPDDDVLTEIRLAIPQTADALSLHHFDASGGDVTFTTHFRSIGVPTSSQGNWSSGDINLNRWDRGAEAAVTIAGGREIPNDVTIFIADQNGATLPMQLPARTFRANRRPDPQHAITPLSCSQVAFSAAGTADSDGDSDGIELTYTWRFHDALSAFGGDVTRTYSKPGLYSARLEVRDGSGLVADGRAQNFSVFVKEQPVARAAAPRIAARGVPVRFDATASTSRGVPIAEYIWTFPGGEERRGDLIDHVFETPGTYRVALRIEDETEHPCNWAATELDIVINERPTAAAGPDHHVAVDGTIAFDASSSADNDGALTSYAWDFGDGGTSGEIAVAHSYAQPGTYRVELNVVDDAGVENSGAADDVTVVVNAPPVAAAGSDLLVAPAQVVTLDGTASHDPDGSVASYAWVFGDGTSAAGAIVQHAFDAPGEYTVRLRVTDQSGVSNNEASDTLTVRVNAQPVPEAGREERVSIGEVVRFDGTASADHDGGQLSYAWDFGDGASGEGAAPSHTYEAAGEYGVQLTVRDAHGVANSAASDHTRVIVNAQPMADAGVDRTVAAGDIFTFDGSASNDPDGNIVAYEWDFGDGGTGTGATPVHSFAWPGSYTVILKITDDSTTRTSRASDTMSVVVTDAPNSTPVASAGDDVTALVGEIIRFDASGSGDPDGNIVSYNWDFGDGTAAKGPSPAYAYARPGAYDVTLTIHDDSGLGNDLSSDRLKVTVLDQPNASPVSLAGRDVTAAVGEVIPLDGSASGDPDGNLIVFDWDFGDGTRASGPVLAHAYAQSGTYEVRLSVRDDSGLENQHDDDTLTVVVNEPPVAEAGADRHVTIGVVLFDGRGSTDDDGLVIRYDWEFGDGQRGSGPTPEHVYRDPGQYTVKLTVTDNSGTSTAQAGDTMQVVVNAAPIADAGPDMIGAPGEQLVFSGDQSLDPDGNVAIYSWNFRDGTMADGQTVFHAFDQPGTYYVRLSVQDDTNHESAVDFAETTVVINAEPTADAGHNMRAAPGDEVVFTGSNSFDTDGQIVAFRWDFSDLDGPVDGAVVRRTFDEPGSYTAQLTVIDDSDAINGIAQDTVSMFINHQPVAEAGRDIETSDLTVVFDGSDAADADGDGLTFLWDFGEGNTATGPRVVHTYDGGGSFPVVLTVDDGSGLGNSSHRDAMTVRINRTPLAVAGDNRRACTNDVLVFDGSDSTDPDGGVLRYRWEFGDGSVSSIVNPTKTFETAGIFPVTLTVQDDSGLANASHSERIIVRVDQAPIAEAGPDLDACSNSPVRFDGSRSTDIDGVVNYFSWDFGDGMGGAGDRPTHTYTRPGQYRGLLSIEGDQIGQCHNSATDEVFVNVIAAPIAQIAAPGAVPVGVKVSFNAAGSNFATGTLLGWSWDFGDGTQADGVNVTHTYTTPGVYSVVMKLQSDASVETCRIVETSHLITVNAPPVADAGRDRVAVADEELQFDASASDDPDGGISRYDWDFGDGNTASGLQVRHTYREPGSYTVALRVTDNTDLENNATVDEIGVQVSAPDGPRIEGPAAACVAESVNWRTAVAEDGSQTVSWLLGDGAGGSGSSLEHSYERPGRYHVTVFVDDASELTRGTRHGTRVLHVNQPPHAAAGPDRMACPGAPVSFTSAGSSDTDGTLTRWIWDFGDGETAEGAAVDHVYSMPGTYEARLTVVDDSGARCNAATDEVTVVVNAPPVANAGPDRSVWVGGANDALLLDGSGSADPDRDALNFFWELGDGTVLIGERLKHILASAGELPVRLTVSDTSGLPCGSAVDDALINVRQRQ